jgi:hypothetical protein
MKNSDSYLSPVLVDKILNLDEKNPDINVISDLKVVKAIWKTREKHIKDARLLIYKIKKEKTKNNVIFTCEKCKGLRRLECHNPRNPFATVKCDECQGEGFLKK